MLVTSLMLVGAAVDLARWLNARDNTLSAIESAVLAGGRVLQTDANNQPAAVALAKRYYDQAVANRVQLSSDTVNFVVTDGGTAVLATGNAKIATPFMGLAGVPELPLLSETGSEAPKAVIGSGGNAELSLEVAMMLDTSSSMTQPSGSGSTRIPDLKAAASDLVNILVWDNQGTYTSRVALVPFSGDMRIPPALLAQVQDPLWPLSRKVIAGNTRLTLKRTACVAERTGPDKFTDAAPGPGKYSMNAYTFDGQCSQSSVNNTIVPMTSDKVALLSGIGNLAVGGGAAGHIGTAWSYYMLSPNWAAVLPAASTPSGYHLPKVHKIAVLMSDGVYALTHDDMGVQTDISGGNANGASSADQAIAICNNMKNSGIEVYAVGFDIQNNQTAINTLQSCASDAMKYYDAADGTKLKAAFRDIALRVSSLRLVN